MKNIKLFLLFIFLVYPQAHGEIHSKTTKNKAVTAAKKKPLVIGSKAFTEVVLLGEMLALLLEEKYNYKVKRQFNLGGTQFLFEALRSKEIDIYPEYTGTGYAIILNRGEQASAAKIYNIVQTQFFKKFKMVWSQPLGFNNTYAIAVRKNDPRFKDINKVSDLKGKAQSLFLAMDHEFIERKDGYRYMAKTYDLNFSDKKMISMNSGLMYSALKNKQVDMVMAYSTDGRIKAYNLKLLEDDKQFFPTYEAAYLTRNKTLEDYPLLKMAFKDLANNISEKEIINLNDQVDRFKKEEKIVVRNFLIQKNLLEGQIEESKRLNLFKYYYSKKEYLLEIFIEHLILTFMSLILAICFAIPIGILATRKKRFAKIIFPIINTLNTIPSLALLGFLIPLLGIGYVPAITALFIYSLLPLIRNTYEGIRVIDPNFIEVALGIGLTKFQILKRVEWPLALSVIIGGVRTSAVIVVGTATLAALIGAGGLGEPIFRGISTVNSRLILLGAIPAALLAIAIDRVLSLIEQKAVSKGLRLNRKFKD